MNVPESIIKEAEKILEGLLSEYNKKKKSAEDLADRLDREVSERDKVREEIEEMILFLDEDDRSINLNQILIEADYNSNQE
jgi:hypothetical protein